MDFKVEKAKKCYGTEKVLKNMNKITGKSTGNVEEGLENTIGKMNDRNIEVEGYLTGIGDGKAVAKIVDNLNATGKSNAKKLAEKMEKGGPIAFRGKGKKSKRK